MQITKKPKRYLNQINANTFNQTRRKNMRSLIILLSFLLVCEGNIDSRCLQPVNGPVCRALVKRWSYDPTTNKCKTFMYGGCGGTENNFLSEEECIKTCVRRSH
ncbi:Kunitz/Bovine pancreatic trypsin inhibitor domain protein [Necator americanus]|uniref:Kunitz/Bovine pancreatic trypsin inhibitor domain protein n=1 Tax=Necator americanus TaxID=51031 RepID=W2T3P3_NECAM|nr:Kunitz/Bovine pancreatic trypsin inhibitor domain protein [Necator americanus]ETN76174.1 Kunitz/Bovine pancreatic trypsin inhibitor domain protein [Necator americanus]